MTEFKCYEHYDDSGQSSELDEEDKEEMEIALYSQIHFESQEKFPDSTASEDVTCIYARDENLSHFKFKVEENCSKSKKENFDNIDAPKRSKISRNVDEFGMEDENMNSKYVVEKSIIPPSANRSVVCASGEVICLSDSESGSIISLDSGLSDSDIINIKDSSDPCSRAEEESSDADSDDLMLLDEEVSVEKTKGLQFNIEGLPQISQKVLAGGDYTMKHESKTSVSFTPTTKRYYSPITARCFNCKEIGHISNACPKPKKHMICHLCGLASHNCTNCPSKVCYNCQGIGHTSKQCNRPRNYNSRSCSRCQMFGHNADVCPDQWRMYHLTTDPMNLVKVKAKSNNKTFCHNCASSKHFAFECKRKRMNAYVYPCYPFVCEYLPHTDTKELPQRKFSRTSKEYRMENQRPDKFLPRSDKKSFKHQMQGSHARFNPATGRKIMIDSNWKSMRHSHMSRSSKKQHSRQDSLGDIHQVINSVIRNDLDNDNFPRSEKSKKKKDFAEDDFDHQVFHNEYWNKNQRGKRKYHENHSGNSVGVRNEDTFHSPSKKKKFMGKRGNKNKFSSKQNIVDRGFRKSM